MITNMGNNTVDNPYVLPTRMKSGMNNPGSSKVLGQTILSYLTAPRLLWIPNGTGVNNSTEPDLSGQNNTMTYKGTHTMGTVGFARKDTFDGVTNYLVAADADSLSFGNGSADIPWSLLCWMNIINSESTKTVIAKGNYGGTKTTEWRLQLGADESISMLQNDNSGNIEIEIVSAAGNSGITFYVYTNSGTGGATAMNTANIYINGSIIASPARANNASYVAMENLGGECDIGARLNNASYERFYPSYMMAIALTAEVLSASTILAMYNSTRGYFGV